VAATPEISTRTSVGAQWFKDELYQARARLNLATGRVHAELRRVAGERSSSPPKTPYGLFVEEQIGWREKLFLTGGARRQEQRVRSGVGNTVYPRVDFMRDLDESWWPRMEWFKHLHLRTAYGKAGVQPTVAAFLSAQTYPTDAGETPGLRLSSIGDRTCRKSPPRSRRALTSGSSGPSELEATFFKSSRTTPCLTGPRRRTARARTSSRTRTGSEPRIQLTMIPQSSHRYDHIRHSFAARSSGTSSPTQAVHRCRRRRARNVEGFPLFDSRIGSPSNAPCQRRHHHLNGSS
jgi:hypothetical protein